MATPNHGPAPSAWGDGSGTFASASSLAELRQQTIHFCAYASEVGQDPFRFVDRLLQIACAGYAAALHLGGEVAGGHGTRFADGERLRMGLEDLADFIGRRRLCANRSHPSTLR